MTLTKIEVKDFQSIEAGEVEVGSFTVFTGPSSSGKSSFMRAAQVVIRNNFTPSQVRQGAKDTEVAVWVDGHKIKATRGSKTGYSMDGEEWTKVGRNGPPDEVTKVLALPMISEVESTFSTQFDKPYLIADAGSVGSKVLGSLTNVSVLHGSLKEASRRVKETNATLKIRANDIETIAEQLKGFADVDRMEDLVQEAQTKLESISKIESEVGQLSDLLNRIRASVEAYGEATEAIKDLGPAEKLLTKVETRAEVTLSLSTHLGRIQTLEDSRPTWDFAKVPKGVDLTAVEEKLARMTGLSDVTQAIVSKVEFLHSVMADKELAKAKEADMELQYASLFEGLENSICPLCEMEILSGSNTHNL